MRMRVRLPTLFALFALLLPACRGCDRSGEPTSTSPSTSASVKPLAELTEADRKGAEDVVVSYFAAVSTKSCAEMGKLVYKLLTL